MIEGRWLAMYRRCHIAMSKLECNYDTATEGENGYYGLPAVNWHSWSS
jgi:hypothetical protein